MNDKKDNHNEDKAGDKESNTMHVNSPSSLRRLLDSVDVNLIPYRLYYLFMFASNGALFPYLPLYLKQMGLAASQAGLIVGIRYFLEIFGSLWGWMADRYKRRKLFVCVAICGFTVKMMLFLAIQPRNQRCVPIQENSTIHDKRRSLNTSQKALLPIHTRYDSSGVEHKLDYTEYKKPTILQWKSATSDAERHKLINKAILNNEAIKGTATATGLRVREQLAIRKVNNKDIATPVETVILMDGTNNQLITSIKNSSRQEILYDYKHLLDHDELHNIFVILVLITVVGELLGGSAIYTLMDASTCEYLGEMVSKFGQVVVFAQVGNAIAVFTVGAIVNSSKYMACGQVRKDYFIPFYFFAGFNCVALFSTLLLKMVYRESAQAIRNSRWNELTVLIRTLRNFSMLFATVIIGGCLGFILNFNLWFLDDLGASPLVLGIAGGVYYLGDVIGTLLSSFLIRCCGHAPLLVLAFANYTVTLLCMSFTYHPIVGAVLFCLQSGMFGISWPAIVSFFAAQTMSVGLVNTVQGIVQALFWGIGFGAGTMLGGKLIDHFGARVTYRIFSVAAGGTLVVFMVMQLVGRWQEKRHQADTDYQLLQAEDREDPE